MTTSNTTLTSLDECLSQNAEVLGPGYANLGTIERTGWWLNHKIFLSFGREGWSVVKLNWIQLFLRNFLCFYKNTHLMTLFRRLLIFECSNKALEERLEALLFSPKKNFTSVWGTADVVEAQIFLFPESHVDKAYLATRTRYINDHYREGDVVLAETFFAGEPLSWEEKHSPGFQHIRIDHLKQGIQIYGMEPKDYQPPTEDPKFLKIVDMYIKIAQWDGKLVFCEQNFEAEGLDLANIMREFQEIIDYYIPDPNRYFAKGLESAEKIVKEFCLRSKEAPDPALYFKKKLVGLLGAFPGPQHVVDAYVKHHPQWVLSRNFSLATQIQRFRLLGKRVFVLAGASHLLSLPGCDDPEVVHTALKGVSSEFGL